MITKNDIHVLVLLSGGIDSATCLAYYKSLGYNIRALFIDYGQPALSQERESSRNIASYYEVLWDIVKIDIKENFSKGEIKGRNAFLLMCTLMKYQQFKGLIAIGIHAGVPYYDTEDIFLQDVQKIFDGYVNGVVKVDAPFLKWEKEKIIYYAVQNRVPINMTYSCENGNKPCGHCMSCLDREIINAM